MARARVTRRSRARWPGRRLNGERGMVTAEIAVAIPAVVFVAIALIAGIVAVSTQMECVDAAREGARAAARGEPLSEVEAIVRRSAPAGAELTVTIGSETVTVEVRVRFAPMGGRLGSWTISGSATARNEPTMQQPP